MASEKPGPVIAPDSIPRGQPAAFRTANDGGIEDELADHQQLLAGHPEWARGQAGGQLRSKPDLADDERQVVDEAIDATAAHFNLRDAIEDLRSKAEEAKDQNEKNSMVERGKWCQAMDGLSLTRWKGVYHLRRYFHLLVFQAYLNDRAAEEEIPYSFESFVKHRPGMSPHRPMVSSQLGEFQFSKR